MLTRALAKWQKDREEENDSDEDQTLLFEKLFTFESSVTRGILKSKPKTDYSVHVQVLSRSEQLLLVRVCRLGSKEPQAAAEVSSMVSLLPQQRIRRAPVARVSFDTNQLKRIDFLQIPEQEEPAQNTSRSCSITQDVRG